MVDINRYARHISLPDVGIEGQRLIDAARVLVVGAGGLGSPALMYLAAAGVGHIGIIDDDVVDLSNLQRQIIHRESEIDMAKVESAKSRILDINSAIDVTIWNERLSPDNAHDIIAGWDLVVDGSDNIPTRYLVDDTCSILGIPWVYGSIYRFEGQISLFNHNKGPCYRDLFPEPPPSDMIPSCQDGGVFGVLPGVVGAIQATEAIKVILGKDTTLAGKLLLYDADQMTFKKLNFAKNQDTEPDPAEVRKMFEDNGWCSNEGQLEKPSINGQNMFKHLSVAEYQEKRSSGWKPFLIDVRSDNEYAQARVSFTDLQVPHEDILSKQEEIPRGCDIILLCRSGMRSQTAAMYLLSAGFSGENLYNFDGGIMAWSNHIPDDIE